MARTHVVGPGDTASPVESPIAPHRLPLTRPGAGPIGGPIVSRVISHLVTALVAAISAPLLVPLAAPLGAQVVRLERPDAVLPDAFSFVRGVRELADGRLLVADWIENRVALVDLAAGSVRDVMREGPGPQELRLPMGLVPLRADSTLLLDYGNNRLTVLAPSGRAVRSILAEQPGRGGVRGTDDEGCLYHAVPAWAERERSLPDDSVRIVRWDGRGDAVVTVAVVQGTRYRKDRSPAMQPRIPIVGYAAQDAWTVLPDGRLAIVRASPYRVEFHAPGRAPRIGPSLPTTARPVTAEDRRRFIREFHAGSAESGRGPNGGMGRAPLPSAAEVERMVGTTEWAATHPPFDAGAVLAAADGAIWVGMPAEPGRPRRYDVFDGSGRRVRQVEVGVDRRVVVVGRRGVYVVADGEDGVQSIERYRLP